MKSNMSEEQQAVLMIKGLLTELTAEQKATFDRYHAGIKAMLAEDPTVAMLAVALVGAETALQEFTNTRSNVTAAAPVSVLESPTPAAPER